MPTLQLRVVTHRVGNQVPGRSVSAHDAHHRPTQGRLLTPTPVAVQECQVVNSNFLPNDEAIPSHTYYKAAHMTFDRVIVAVSHLKAAAEG